MDRSPFSIASRRTIPDNNISKTPGNMPPNPPVVTARSKIRDLLLAFAAFVVVFLLWQTRGSFDPLLYPFRLLVTFVHETGHGLASIVTGGRFLNFVVTQEGAGLAQTSGGSGLLILPMGYLGAALFGAVLLYSANVSTRPDRVAVLVGAYFVCCAVLFTSGGLTIALIGLGASAILWVLASAVPARKNALRLAAIAALVITGLVASRNLALFVGLVAGAAFLLTAAVLPRVLVLFLLNFTALITGFNAVSDVAYLWSNASVGMGIVRNDAAAMADLTRLPVQLWIALWLIAAFALMGLAVWGVLRYVVAHLKT